MINQLLNKLYRHTACILIALFVGVYLHAQDIEITDVAVPFTTTTIADMAQDKIGNIWIASNNQGLYKYNGDDFELFNHQRDNANSIVSDRLECIYIDKGGIIWIGSFASGISRFDPVEKTFTHYKHERDDPNSIRSNGIRRFVEDNHGRIWVATLRGLDYWDPETNVFKRDFKQSEDFSILDKEHIRALYLDKSGILWAGTSSPFYGEQSEGGLFRIDPEERSVKRFVSSVDSESLIDNVVTSVFEDSRGVFWVGTAGDGLHTMDREIGKFQRLVNIPGDPQQLSRPPVKGFSYAMDHIRFIEEDDSGKIWIGTMNGGINVYDPSNGTIEHLHSARKDKYNVPTNDFWSALKTKDGLMWLGAWSPGDTPSKLMKVNFSPIKIRHIDTGGPSYSFVDAPVIGNSSTSILVGSYRGIYRINFRDAMNNSYYFTEESLENIRHLAKDANSNIWASTEKGLIFYNFLDNNHELYPIYDDEISIGEQLVLNQTAIISPDSILVATNNGLFLFEHQKKAFQKIEYSPPERQEKEPMLVETVYIDTEKRIWVGYSNHGLQRLSSDLKSFKDYRFLIQVQDGALCLKEDKNHRLYVGNRRSGLKVYDNERDTFFQVNDKNGLLKSESSVSGMSFVSDSVLWLTTNIGLINLNLNTQISSHIEIPELNEYEITSNGFFTSGNNGYSYFGTSYGYIKYKPEDFKSFQGSNVVPAITKVLSSQNNITSKFAKEEGDVRLKYDQNDLSFTLNYIDFVSGIREKQLEYRLEGYDEKWRKGSNDEEVLYYRLAAGDYSFTVRKLGGDGQWREDSVAFTILNPWWKTWWAYGLYALTACVLLVSFNRIQREKAVQREREKTRDRELAQAKEIEKAYDELKSTQAQLIQSEKMASLGELTAGIAHEIQNPLNFVNNFSEVSAELMQELTEELDKGDVEEAKDISKDIIENLEKISHHGSRASGIVKGMLDHSRASTGEKSPTDINALCDEYLRLSYHGLRAKDKSFNAAFETDFDESLPKINVIPQDIGRVLLNVINNAFYAVDQRKKSSEDVGYEPKVTISTRQIKDKLEIRITDNGIGMSQETIDKVFQPFFTTKPTGQGTGLGMSISYDIVTKGHGGELKVESEKGKGTIFTIILPK